MAETINKLSVLTALDGTQIEKALLSRLLPTLRAYQDGQKCILKKHMGMNVEWTRFESLKDDTTAASEGVPPSAEPMTPTVIKATAEQYVRGIKLTDILLERGKHKCKAEAVKLLSEVGRKMIDTLTISKLVTAQKKYYGGGKTASTITATDTIKETDIERMFVYLSNNDVQKYEDGTYHCLITPKSASDIRKLGSFVDKAKYQDPQGRGLKLGEIGKLGGFTFIESTNVATVKAGAANAVECQQLIAYGEDAYGVVDVEDEGSSGNPKLISKALGSAGTDDMGNQIASEAMKFMYVAKILDEKRICVGIAPAAIVL